MESRAAEDGYHASPFNFGITLGVRAFCYSLAVGNSILWKANPQIPTIHYELCKIMHEAGVPPNAFQMLHFTPGTEPKSVEQIVAHPDVRVSYSSSGTTRRFTNLDV